MLTKIKLDACVVILIAPVWSARPWYPELLSLCVAQPLRLPAWDSLLFNPLSRHHSDNGSDFHAWLLSTDVVARHRFLEDLRLLPSSGRLMGVIDSIPLYSRTLD